MPISKDLFLAILALESSTATWKGYITSAMQDEIQFDILGHSRQEPTAGLAWNRGDGNIIRRGAPNPYPFADHCTETELRPSLLDYDRIPPTE
jgi:hypothetical protein